ncbi:hypothetical protein ACRALDRAFT_206732 [Sodiomyces alcalophilus JCM 7366]|uniref:uncharacterized protein n=1 Tax=Sodiomyces alcalophilus JCM 7366 TaxID=591952 RepID=UPI0039B4A150
MNSESPVHTKEKQKKWVRCTPRSFHFPFPPMQQRLAETRPLQWFTAVCDTCEARLVSIPQRNKSEKQHGPSLRRSNSRTDEIVFSEKNHLETVKSVGAETDNKVDARRKKMWQSGLGDQLIYGRPGKKENEKHGIGAKVRNNRKYVYLWHHDDTGHSPAAMRRRAGVSASSVRGTAALHAYLVHTLRHMYNEVSLYLQTFADGWQCIVGYGLQEGPAQNITASQRTLRHWFGSRSLHSHPRQTSKARFFAPPAFLWGRMTDTNCHVRN